jgi:hypothetical protein
VELELGISRKTICDLRNKLQQKGLISFKEGNKRVNGAIYQILYVSEGNKNGNVNGNVNGNPIYKTKNKTKNNNSNELFPPDPPPLENPKKTKPEFIPPTLEDIKAYFEGKLPDWEQQAETFYNHFTSLGWRTASGAKVERWDSRANLWIIEKKQSNGSAKQANDVTDADIIIRSTTG